ncbi:MAG: DEAD/DEAH box helicase, partial [Bacteroidales bacterium]|nr:DEAD/DEAH box helicase [Bacteroidales bacterium]
KELYYKVLFELFGSELLIESENPDFNRQIGRLENTVIYNSLYEFQKNGVRSLIKMLQKYNGAILADSVGLGKTWSALTVMKFFQLQGYEVILICPKKLHNNWNKYLKRQNSKFEKDKFEYLIRFHTDMSENLLEKYCDTSDKYFTDDKPKLFVIDESHNFRNDKSTRYQFLIEKILSKNNNIKVLLLSATPINNNLIDIRNQFKLLTRGENDGFNESLDIKNLEYTFRTAQSAFNEWTAEPNPKLSDFIRKIKTNNFFRLTDSLTVARTRKLIQGEEANLNFPKKGKPINHFVTPRNIGNIESFEELFKYFPPKLSAYLPSFYLEYGALNYESDRFNSDKLRDIFLVKMMYILLVKRLESSWYSFKSTVDRITNHHQNAFDKINMYFEAKENLIQNSIDNDVEFDFDDEENADVFEEFELGKKKTVALSEIDKSGHLEWFKEDIKVDLEALKSLQVNINLFEEKINKETKINSNLKSNDTKLEVLIKQIKDKQKSGFNNNNQKVLIFTTYKDTATYLYDQLNKRGFKKLGLVYGAGGMVCGDTIVYKNFECILERFAPFTKLYMEKEWDNFKPHNKNLRKEKQYNEWQVWLSDNDKRTYEKLENQIDILISTDVLSEGQNLQDCDMVINYDIHWNPVRIIQRLGRIDRLGSINETIWGVNFWPSDNINTYLNLQSRVEQRMAVMTLAGSEIDINFSDTLKKMLDDDTINLKQQSKMMEQMQTTWDDIEDNNETLGFDKLSLEQYRQDLNIELSDKVNLYKNMPNAIFTGFGGQTDKNEEEGIIALLGYPKKPIKAKSYKYKYFELIYIDKKGNDILANQREVLDFLANHKECERKVDSKIDNGESESIKELSNS